ncbi:type I-E CRISPR-associated protein Cse1/CasA [Myceligenerans crystallogenes]|uniref:Type I-E CRISPR-associated protein Cse1/CasA n=1 Tax=Myceligenerans crystallogenes TaxID=316335 RepID=A0ABN2NK76_9MICO
MSETTQHAAFDLTVEPWIVVLDKAGVRREMSIRDAFREAGEISQIVGEVPTQGFAILRVLLAILHRAVDGPRFEEGEDRSRHEHWCEVRDDWDGVVGAVGEYLDEYRERFDLRHPVTPFFQVAGLSTAAKDAAGLEMLIADVPNGQQYQTTRSGRGTATITWAEGARWLVHAHAYDPSGIRGAAIGDPRAKGGKGYPIGPGWSGQIGGVFLQGATLRDTLLLNLTESVTAGLETVGTDVPVWERPALTAAPDGGPDGREPTGPLDLYTWQTRRIRLVGDGVVHGVVLCNGDKATPQNRFRLEPLTAWRWSDPQTKKFKQDTWMPRKHDPSRAIWRGLAGLLTGASGSKDKAPGVLRFAEELLADGVLTEPVLTVRAVGITYGPQEATISEITDDHLDLPAEIVAHGDGETARLAVLAVEQADRAVYQLASFAQNLALAAGGDTESSGPRDRAREAAFAELDPMFRRWLLSLATSDDLRKSETVWQRDVAAVVHRQADDLAGQAGPAAVVGRQARGRHIDLGLAHAWIRAGVAKELPLAAAERRRPRNERDDKGES